MTVDWNKPIEVHDGAGNVRTASTDTLYGFRIIHVGPVKLLREEQSGALVHPSGLCSAWRVRNVAEKPAVTPMSVSEFPKGTVWVRRKTWSDGSRDLVLAVVGIGHGYIIHNPISPTRVSFHELAANYQMSTDGETWTDCQGTPF